MVCGGDIDLDMLLDDVLLLWLLLLLLVMLFEAFVKLCNRIDCFVSHGGLYSFCSTICMLLLSMVVLGQRLRSLIDLFDLIELLNSSPRLNAADDGVFDAESSVGSVALLLLLLDWATTFMLLLRLLLLPVIVVVVVVVVLPVLDCC